MSRDLRKYASQTSVQLIIGAFIILFVIGLGLIAWFYGLGAALTGFLCLLGALIPIALIVLALKSIDYLVNRIDKN